MNTQLKEALKIGVSCLFGGGIGVYAALAVMSISWKLGLATGLAAAFVAGYSLYQVKEIPKAISITFKRVAMGTGNSLGGIGKGISWLYHHPPLVTFVSLTFFLSWKIMYVGSEGHNEGDRIFGFLIIGLMLFFGLLAFWVFQITGLGKAGENEVIKMAWIIMIVIMVTALIRLVWLTAKFLVYGFWKWLFIKAIPGTWNFGRKFFWEFFILIHSKQRLICGVDSTIGCGAAYVWLAEPGMSLPQKVTTIACGGLLGAAFGIFNWEIVSKKWLKLHLPKPAEV